MKNKFKKKQFFGTFEPHPCQHITPDSQIYSMHEFIPNSDQQKTILGRIYNLFHLTVPNMFAISFWNEKRDVYF